MKNIFFAFLAIVALCSCNELEEPWNPVKPEKGSKPKNLELTVENQQTAENLHGFYMDFFKETCKGSDNRLCSPLSATFCTAMFANLVDEELKTQFETVYHSSMDDVNSLCNKMLFQLPCLDPKVNTFFANSWWYDEQFSANAYYEKFLNDNYNAASTAYPIHKKFDKFQSLVKKWVSDNTEGLIDDFKVEEADFVLANTLYFYGLWKGSFNEGATKKGTFHGIKGDSSIPMMRGEISSYVYNGTLCNAIKIPFGADKYSAVFVAPNGDVSQFLENGEMEAYYHWEFEPHWVKLIMPKFSIVEGVHDITDNLVNMGLTRLKEHFILECFDQKPKNHNLAVRQAATLEFDERGAKGAALTVITLETSTGKTPQYVDFTIDKPFLFMITENSTGAVLFAGKILNL